MAHPVAPRLSIRDLGLSGKRLFLRVDHNVPMKDGVITDDTRIRETLPTIRLALEAGAAVILASHLGRPKGGPDSKTSLRPVATRLGELLGGEVRLAPDCIGPETLGMARALAQGHLLMLENLRWHAAEQAGDAAFADQLAALANEYANDAFGTCHRADASVALVPTRFSRPAAGLLIERELKALGRLLTDPARPFVAVIGGATVSDKLPVMRGLLPEVDAILVGGAMAYTFMLARGVGVGNSRTEPDLLDAVRALDADALASGKRILLPTDHVVAPGITPADVGGASVHDGGIVEGMGVDIGPATRAAFARDIASARSILWNGPMGVFEVDAFAEGTAAVARAVASSPAYSVVGGGDSIAALNAAGLASRVGHVSTGGGALLELLAGEPMPGLAALAPQT